MKRIEPNLEQQPLTHASGILSGNDLRIAGQIGADIQSGELPDNFTDQSHNALLRLVSVVVAAGGSARDVTMMTIYVTDMALCRTHIQTILESIASVFGGHLPAMSLIGISDLMSPEYMIEIDGHARISVGE